MHCLHMLDVYQTISPLRLWCLRGIQGCVNAASALQKAQHCLRLWHAVQSAPGSKTLTPPYTHALQVAECETGDSGSNGCAGSGYAHGGAAWKCFHLWPSPLICSQHHHADLHDGRITCQCLHSKRWCASSMLFALCSCLSTQTSLSRCQDVEAIVRTCRILRDSASKIHMG